MDGRTKVELLREVQIHVFRAQALCESSYILYSPFYESVKRCFKPILDHLYVSELVNTATEFLFVFTIQLVPSDIKGLCGKSPAIVNLKRMVCTTSM